MGLNLDLKDDYGSLEELEAAVAAQVERQNSTSVEEFDNLSPVDMHHILDFTFEEKSPLGFRKNIAPEVLAEIPFLNLSLEYLRVIQESKNGELKLTAKGNLPVKLVKQLYDTGFIKADYIESGVVKLYKESDATFIRALRTILDLASITKKRNNKMSLTAKGKAVLRKKTKQDLLEIIFETNCKRFNLGYFDGYPQTSDLQFTFGYTLYLLLQYGKKRRELGFYVDKNLEAFPTGIDHFEDKYSAKKEGYKRCYNIRIFERFLCYYGFLEHETDKKNWPLENEHYLKTTNTFDAVFEIRKDKLSFRKSKYQA